MSFGFNSQIVKQKDATEYAIQITTDNYEQFLFIQEMARQCVDGKHKEKCLNSEVFTEQLTIGQLNDKLYNELDMLLRNNPLQPIPRCCSNCPNDPSNGGSGNCSCSLPYVNSSINITTNI